MQQPIKSSKSRPSVAIVMGSGGIRSLSGLPLLELIKEKRVPIDTLIGTGGGAILEALFACGFPSRDIPDLMATIFAPKLYDQLDFRQILKILGMRSGSFVSPPAPYKNVPLQECLKSIFQDKRVEDLPYRLQIHCTEMSTGDIVVLDKGLLCDCLYATNATYPFLPPIEIDGQWLAGGVFTAAIPIMTAVKQQMDFIFMLSFNDERHIQAKSFFEYVNTFFIRSCTNTQARQIALAISLHQGETVLMNVAFNKSIGVWDTSCIQDILEAGKKTLGMNAEYIDEVITQARMKDE